MTLKNLINNKLRDVKLNHSNGTYRFYLSHTSHFLSWCSNREIELVDQVSEDIIVDYITDLKKTCSNSTINKRIGILKRVWQYSNIEFNYLFNISKLKERYTTFSNLNEKVYLKIREYVYKYPEVKDNDIFHKCLLSLLIDTGARIDEIINIEKKNTDVTNATILLTKTKTNQDREIYFTKQTVKIIKKMMAINHHSEKLLYNFAKKRPANYEDARYLMKKIKSAFNLEKLSTHMFRHTIATLFIEKNVNIYYVMKILGHQNIKTTQRYLHSSNKNIKNSFDKLMNNL